MKPNSSHHASLRRHGVARGTEILLKAFFGHGLDESEAVPPIPAAQVPAQPEPEPYEAWIPATAAQGTVLTRR